MAIARWTHGPSFEEDGVRFRLWAPAQKRLALALESRGAAIPMERRDGDFFEVFVERIGAGRARLRARSAIFRSPRQVSAPDAIHPAKVSSSQS